MGRSRLPSFPHEEPEVVRVDTWMVGIRALQGGWWSRVETRLSARQAPVFREGQDQGRELPTLEAPHRLVLKQNQRGIPPHARVRVFPPFVGSHLQQDKGPAAWPLCPEASRMAQNPELTTPAFLQKGQLERFLQGWFFNLSHLENPISLLLAS